MEQSKWEKEKKLILGKFSHTNPSELARWESNAPFMAIFNHNNSLPEHIGIFSLSYLVILRHHCAICKQYSWTICSHHIKNFFFCYFWKFIIHKNYDNFFLCNIYNWLPRNCIIAVFVVWKCLKLNDFFMTRLTINVKCDRMIFYLLLIIPKLYLKHLIKNSLII